MTTLESRLNRVRARILAAERDFQRPPGSVKLLAVSKTRPATDIRQCMALGQSCFGENRLQEALDKIRLLESDPPQWHFIGAIQSNKTAQIAAHFDWVHSVDRLKIARRLAEQRPRDHPPLNVCLQVNISAEQSKSGVAPEALSELATAIVDLQGIRLRGLMAVPAPCDDQQRQRRPFARLRELWQQLNDSGLSLDTLSMGMTADLEAAIAEGATMVRIGTAIFGPRPLP